MNTICSIFHVIQMGELEINNLDLEDRLSTLQEHITHTVNGQGLDFEHCGETLKAKDQQIEQLQNELQVSSEKMNKLVR